MPVFWPVLVVYFIILFGLTSEFTLSMFSLFEVGGETALGALGRCLG